MRHAFCVDDPLSLPDVRDHFEFRKWTVAVIRGMQLASTLQVQNHNDLVDALEELHPGTRAAYKQFLLCG